LFRFADGEYEQRVTATDVDIGEHALGFGDIAVVGDTTASRHSLFLTLEDDRVTGEFNDPYNEGTVAAIELGRTELRTIFVGPGPMAGRITMAKGSDPFEDEPTDKSSVDDEWMEVGDIALDSILVRIAVEPSSHARILAWLRQAVARQGGTWEGMGDGALRAVFRPGINDSIYKEMVDDPDVETTLTPGTNSDPRHARR
jgi:hypothetical protein